jgi:hypothetical protein
LPADGPIDAVASAIDARLSAIDARLSLEDQQHVCNEQQQVNRTQSHVGVAVCKCMLLIICTDSVATDLLTLTVAGRPSGRLGQLEWFT